LNQSKEIQADSMNNFRIESQRKNHNLWKVG
jgi:hypothetical protein